VVHEKSLVDAKPVWQSAQTGQVPPATTFGSERLTPEEFALIEAFLNRRNSLPSDVRFNMADQIARQIQPKLSLPPGELFYAEKTPRDGRPGAAFQCRLLLIRFLQLSVAARRSAERRQHAFSVLEILALSLQSLVDTIPSLFYSRVSW